MSLQANMELGVCGDGCDHDVTHCYNLGYCYYEHLQEDLQNTIITEEENDKNICLLCGEENNRQYCKDTNCSIYKGKNKGN